MITFLLLIIVILLLHSLYTLSIKYLNIEKPFWLKAYALVGGLYIISIPPIIAASLIIKLCYSESSVPIFVGGIVFIIMVLIVANIFPKEKGTD